MYIDLKDFYLGTPMNWYEYMWIKMADTPQDIINQYGLTEKSVNGKVLVEIRKGMYGLKQAGRISNGQPKQNLKASGYMPCRYTPGLFTYIIRKISFALCVDDFGVKYTDKAAGSAICPGSKKKAVVWAAVITIGVVVGVWV